MALVHWLLLVLGERKVAPIHLNLGGHADCNCGAYFEVTGQKNAMQSKLIEFDPYISCKAWN